MGSQNITLFDCFNNDMDGLSITTDLSIGFQDKFGQNFQTTIKFKVSNPVVTSGTYYVVYLPNNPRPLDFCYMIIHQYKEYHKKMGVGEVKWELIGGSTKLGIEKSTTDVLTIYCENNVMDSFYDKKPLDELAKEKSLIVFLRDETFRREQEQRLQLHAFISHDSRDKELIAEPIAHEISAKLRKVWYDEYSLKLGDNLRESIEKGIREARKCILVLTPNFLNNPGWTKREFESIFTKEIIEKRRVILPIWHKVSADDIYNYSTSLAGTFALHWPDKEMLAPEAYKKSIEQIIEEIIKQLDKPVVA